MLLPASLLALMLTGCEAPVATDPAEDPLLSPGPSAAPAAPAGSDASAAPDTSAGSPAPAAPVPAQAVIEGDLGRRLDDYFSRLSVWGFSGAALMSRGDDVLLARGYGYADREARRPFTTDTVFTIGSITKPFTGAAVLELVSQGRVSLDDPIGMYFDDVPDDKKGIQIHHLLTHSAGFPGAIGDDFETIDRDAYVRRALATPLDFPPGAAYEYSNVGYSLLGALVERVTGEDYETFLRRELLLPAGMTDTGYVLPGWPSARLAVGYRDGARWGTFDEKPRLEDGPGWHLRANGGLHSTLWDMRRWLDVVRGSAAAASAVLPDEQRRMWIAPHVDEGMGGSWYGYGWTIEKTPWGRIIAHNGGNRIFTADFFWFEEADLFVFAASNSSLARVAEMRMQIARVLFEPDAPLPEVPAAYAAGGDFSAAASEAFPEAGLASGLYALDDGTRIELVSDDGRLRFRPEGQTALDALLDTPTTQRERFASLNTRALQVWDALSADDPDAFASVSDSPEQAAQRAERMAGFLGERARHLGAFEGIDLIGSTPPRPLPDLPPDVAATTWGLVRFARGAVAFGMLWTEDGRYIGTSIGPPEDLPLATLVPLPPDAGDGQASAHATPTKSPDGPAGDAAAGAPRPVSFQGRLTGFPGLTPILTATFDSGNRRCLRFVDQTLCRIADLPESRIADLAKK